MKIFFITAAFAGLLLFSCSKTNRTGQEIITGTWELRKETGGIIAIINYKPGNGTMLTFNDNESFTAKTSNGSSSNGTWSIKESANPGDWILTLQYASLPQPLPQTDSIRFGQNQLIVLPFATCCDIPTAYYEHLN